MSGSRRGIVILLLVAPLLLPVAAESPAAELEHLDLENVRELHERAAGDTAIGDDLRSRILELYDEAIGSLEAADGFKRDAADRVRERAGVGRMVEALRKQLGRPDPVPESPLPEEATLAQARNLLARERSRLSADLAELRKLEQLVESRAALRNDLARSLGTLDQETESLSVELLAATQSDLHADLKLATQISIQTRQERNVVKIDALREHLAVLDARATLLPWRIDQAQRRVDHGEIVVGLLESATQDLRRREAAQLLEQIRQRTLEASDKAESLQAVAAETEQLAEMLWGPGGAEALAEEAARSLGETKKHQADLDRIVQLTRRKFEAFGHRGNITRWWPETPEDFPEPGEVAGIIRDLQRRLPETQHDLIRLEQRRSDTRRLLERTYADLRTEVGDESWQELQPLARDLINERRELLESLIRIYTLHSNQLIELEAKTRHFFEEGAEVQDFLYSRMLWVRSVPKPILPRPAKLAETARWYFDASHWKELVGALWAAVKDARLRSLVVLAAFGLLLGLRRLMRSRMRALAGRTATPETDTYRATLEALLYTVLLALPLPLALHIAGGALSDAEGSAFLYAAARALPYLAWMAALMELTRQFLAPDGLAEAHFGWPRHVARSIHNGLLWPEAIFLPAIFVAVQIAFAGMQLQSPATLQSYNNSLGRVIFVAALIFLGLTLLGLFRPRKRVETPHQARASAWLDRLYLFAYPGVALATLVPAGLAALGYYITGFLLAYQMLRTLWLASLLLILSGLLVRWREVSSRITTGPGEPGPDASATADLPQSERQVRELFRFVVVLVAAFGLYSIWAEALPTLQIMKRIELLPKVALVETVDHRQNLPEPMATEPVEAAEGEPAPSAKAPGVSLIPGGGSGVTPAAVTETRPLTLWHLLQALLALLITVVLVKNIPGVLEFTLRRRTRIDSGARIALGTLLRYTIIIVGVSAAFSLLGVSWSKIQWLAAALTFGLGFGLQEIVANFVSGLILLIERPVRVGDAVTMGNLQGRVSKIRIRATTITLWDGSEMIVPNKEFITTKLVNWTLSDSRRRIEIPVRVAYGANLQEIRGLLVEVARKNPLIFDEPAPHVLVLEFGDDAIKYELRYYVDFGDGLQTRDEVHMGIDRAFRERGIEVPLPQLSLHLPAGREGEATAPEQRSNSDGGD